MNEASQLNLMENQLLYVLLSHEPLLTRATKAIAYAIAASTAALVYSELLYQGTRRLYLHGKLLRYYPLPQNRNILIASLNAFAFIAPTALFATVQYPDLHRSWKFNPLSILIHTALYLAMHDIYFYAVHTTFHKLRTLYDYFHAMHHDIAYAMNVYAVGYAEMTENFLQVGIPWMIWTYFTNENWWNWLLPLSLIVFTTLIGHSGYRMDKSMALFHPLIFPFILVGGSCMLTPGDHQVHHSHRRYNFGLFWRFMDQWNGTYRKCTVRAYDVEYWSKYIKAPGEHEHNMAKWKGKQSTEFVEVEWGF